MYFSQFDNISQYSTNNDTNSTLSNYSIKPMEGNIFTSCGEYIPASFDTYQQNSITDSDIKTTQNTNKKIHQNNINSNKENIIDDNNWFTPLENIFNPNNTNEYFKSKQSSKQIPKQIPKPKQYIKTNINKFTNKNDIKQNNLTKKYLIGLLLGIICILLIDIVIKISNLKIN